MVTLAYERFDRVCSYNDQRRAENDSRNMIRDFKVLIDGEHRATFKKALRRGYELYDVDGRPIGANPRYTAHLGHQVETQSEFEATTQRFLEAGLIPTLAGMAELRVAETEEKAKRAAARIEAARINCIKQAAVELYDALKYALEQLEAYSTTKVGVHHAAIEKARGAIAMAEKQPVAMEYSDA